MTDRTTGLRAIARASIGFVAALSNRGKKRPGRIRFAILTAALVVTPRPTAAAGADDATISAEGMAQVARILQEKESRTAAQRKIDSNILYEIRMRRGEDAAEGVPMLATGLSVDTDGLFAVEIRADVTDAVLARLARGKAVLIDVSRLYRTVAARLPLSEIEALAGLPEVLFIRPYSPPNFWSSPVRTQSTPPANSSTDVPSFGQRAQRVRDFVQDVLPPPSMTLVGSAQSQGDTTHKANVARSTIGPNGSGVKVGVLSNGVANLAASQSSGDLGPVTVLPGQTGTGDEGTAMLEIVHDLAPGAQLYFASANPTVARFAQNIRDLRAAGCDIIIDDVFFFVETPFQDGQAPSLLSNTSGGLIAQAVKDVVASGAMYFASAGNSGNADDNTASCFQGDWADGGTLVSLPGGNVHDFGGGAQSDLIQIGAGSPIDLFWSDPLGGSANDYDLFVFNNALTSVVAASTNVQNGTQDPFEQVGSGNATNNRVVVFKKTGAAARFFHLTINANGTGRLAVATSGTTKGHSAVAGAFSVAATPATAPGPFPNPFSATNVTEAFSSDGPRRIFFDEDGTPFTPGNFSSTGGIVRQKPDITAADGVSVTGAGGFPTTFFGTSAAAPHAGAIAALLKSGLPAPSNTAVDTALRTTAIDIEAAGTDRDTGVGIVMALEAMSALGMTPQAAIDMGAFTVAELPPGSDGDGVIEKGETGTLLVASLVNNGAASATGVTATLTTTTPGVTVIAPTGRSYSNLAAGGGTASNPTPYEFHLGAAYTCAAPVDFLLTVAYNDGSPRSKLFRFTANLATGFSVTTTMDATPPPSSPAYVASTGTQTNRVTRDGRASTCSLSKPTAGVTAAASPRFDAYSFTATSSGCNVVTLTGGPNVGGGTQTFAVVYSGSFDPASVTTNYLADMGSSPAFGAVNSFSFDAVAGQTYVAVVSEVPGAGASPPYTLTVTGPSLTTCDFATGSEADLSITKTDGQTSYVPGDPVVYTITAENAGPGDVTGATIADTIPPGLTGASWTCVASSGSACGAPNGSGSINTTVNLLSGGTATFTLNATVSASETGSLSNTATITAPGGVTDPDPGNNSATDTDAPPGGVYFTVTPCRVLDTRLAAGSLGGPALAAGTTRTFPVTGHCGIPANATALSINLTVTGSTAPGFLIARPTGTSTNVSTINYGSGQTRANNAVIALSGSGELDLRCGQASGTVHAIVDVSGYFVE